MEPLKPRDKVTQHMTRDGLTLDNQTTGESVNVSSREAEQEYTAQPEGAAEKILERADELHDRHKARKAAKDAGETVAQATSPVSRLQFTTEERASPELAPYIKKAEKRADKLEAAKEALPKKRVVTKETVYDEAKGKAKSRLYFDKVEKSPPQLKPNPASRPIQEAGLYLHGKIHEVEHENVGVEGGHKGEELAEQQAGRMIRSGVHRHKLKPYRAAAKAERKSIAANAEFAYQKSLRDNPELAQAAKNPVSRFWQKQHIKREYAKQAREAARQTAKAAGAAATTTEKAAAYAAQFVRRHKGGAVIILLLFCLFLILNSVFSALPSLGTGMMNAVVGTSYTAEDEDILGANEDYTALENELREKIANIERTHPGYDEYRYNVDELGHNPYELTSYLIAKLRTYTRENVQGELRALFEAQYKLTLTEEVEIRYRTETDTWTDEDGTTHTDTYGVSYEYYILHVRLQNKTLPMVVGSLLDAEQKEIYDITLELKGNKPYLWDDIYTSGGGSYDPGSDYTIPGEALSDPAFAALISEAEKYLGWPYVWGGSSPSTSFDCSGFVCWVYTASGVHSLPRTTATGIFNQCSYVSPADAKPGDLIFFTKTYACDGPVSHVGIYVGGGMMIHAGDPIKYASINTSYWQEHFYAFGRLN